MSGTDFDDLSELDEEQLEFEEGEGDEISDEARARAMGWKPRDQYNGDPRRWVDYPEFLRKGEEDLPILRDQNHRMSERLARIEPEVANLRRTVEEQAQAVKDAMALARRSNDAGYQRALRELKQQQREAVQQGDTDAYDLVQEQIDAMEAEREATTRAPEPTAPATTTTTPPAPNQPPPEIGRFVAANASWFNDSSRPYLRQAIINLHNIVIAEGRIGDVGQQLTEAKRRMAAMYPEEPDLGGQMAQDTPRPRPRAPLTLPPRSEAARPPQRRSNDPFDQIEDPTERKEVRAAYERTKRHDESVTAEEYVALYNDPRADVLALRNQRKK